MIAIYSRYSEVERHEYESWTVEGAAEFLQNIEDEGEGYALGIYDRETKTLHIPENMDIAGQDRETVLQQKMEEFKELDLEIDKVEFYDK